MRALVAMLVQTDRFGTSIAQALRTHAEVSRTKRRQRAEERAAKIGVKLVFPLVFCLFPAFYVVTLGPAVIKFAHASAAEASFQEDCSNGYYHCRYRSGCLPRALHHAASDEDRRRRRRITSRAVFVESGLILSSPRRSVRCRLEVVR